MNELESPAAIKRNKIIIAIFTISLVIAYAVKTIINSEYVGAVSFRYFYNQTTSQPMTILSCIFLYILGGIFVGVVPSGIICVFMIFLYMLLNSKDKNFLKRHYSPKYSEELYFGARQAFLGVYAVVLVFGVLHVWGIFDIDFSLFI